MLFRQFFEPETSTYTYLIGCERTHRACLIDSVASQVPILIEYLQQFELRLVYTLETHVHAVS